MVTASVSTRGRVPPPLANSVSSTMEGGVESRILRGSKSLAQFGDSPSSTRSTSSSESSSNSSNDAGNTTFACGGQVSPEKLPSRDTMHCVPCRSAFARMRSTYSATSCALACSHTSPNCSLPFSVTTRRICCSFPRATPNWPAAMHASETSTLALARSRLDIRVQRSIMRSHQKHALSAYCGPFFASASIISRYTAGLGLRLNSNISCK
mmetsp:Transcript_43610/g.81630  ORF Transcript_43610/g.81630 Transcript_43610/m.81630 type:complete len:210 (-) Transcript_43610:1946-2575(-)